MTKISPATEPFFSHDISTRTNKSIKKLINTLGYEGYGLFWAIVEFMHKNELMIGEENLVIDDNYTDKITHILNDYDFFYIKNGCYISDRILRNIDKQEQKTRQNKTAAETRWLLSAFSKEYEIVFRQKPELETEEIEKLKSYYQRIPDFKKLLPDILWTLKNLKFNTDITFKPCANWLLKNNNLSRLLNGEFGPLMHKKTKQEIHEEEKQKQQSKQLFEDNFNTDDFHSKTSAIEFIVKNNSNLQFIIPPHKKLMKKFDITLKELITYKENHNDL